MKRISVILFLLLLLISCDDKNNASNKKINYSKDSIDYQKRDSKKPSFPNWLKKNYPTKIEFENGYAITLKIKDYQNINDSVSFCIYEKLDGVCQRVILQTYSKQTKTDSLEIRKNCDHDLSSPIYNWKDYKITPSNQVIVRDFTESVVESFINNNGEIKRDYDFDDAETKIDTTTRVYKINKKGGIIEIVE